MKLGIFDSGIGGEAVATSLRTTFPDAEIIVVNDRKNVPYGDKAPSQIISLTEVAIQPLLYAACDVIILACNTATALTIETLRAKYSNQKFIGIEPMIKTAAGVTKSDIIAVCATPATLDSQHYSDLVAKYGSHLTILEPDCSTWAYMIENNSVNPEEIKNNINDMCLRGADVIVLGCTHYHWIKELIVKTADGRAQVIEPSEAIGKRVQELLQKKVLYAPN
jgi:glutamate racemase